MPRISVRCRIQAQVIIGLDEIFQTYDASSRGANHHNLQPLCRASLTANIADPSAPTRVVQVNARNAGIHDIDILLFNPYVPKTFFFNVLKFVMQRFRFHGPVYLEVAVGCTTVKSGAAASRRCRIINPSSAVQFSLNCIILAIDSGDYVILVLLDLTAAFDTAGSPAA